MKKKNETDIVPTSGNIVAMYSEKKNNNFPNFSSEYHLFYYEGVSLFMKFNLWFSFRQNRTQKFISKI